ncbi:MAG: DUF4783 domain-containing protein [Paludibacter sp.]|nr:DUF4783 domain-containing protein [Paludibacter sp.]
MKSIKLLLISGLLLFAFSLSVAQSAEGMSEINSALNSGDAGKLSGLMNANVELVIGKVNDVFSKQQATGIISDFFKKNKVSSYLVIHNGNKESANFSIGTLKTNQGDFRVYILTRKTENLVLIQQLRIEPYDD